jgi:hypothetical protein
MKDMVAHTFQKCIGLIGCGSEKELQQLLVVHYKALNSKHMYFHFFERTCAFRNVNNDL